MEFVGYFILDYQLRAIQIFGYTPVPHLCNALLYRGAGGTGKCYLTLINVIKSMLRVIIGFWTFMAVV